MFTVSRESANRFSHCTEMNRNQWLSGMVRKKHLKNLIFIVCMLSKNLSNNNKVHNKLYSYSTSALQRKKKKYTNNHKHVHVRIINHSLQTNILHTYIHIEINTYTSLHTHINTHVQTNYPNQINTFIFLKTPCDKNIFP